MGSVAQGKLLSCQVWPVCTAAAAATAAQLFGAVAVQQPLHSYFAVMQQLLLFILRSACSVALVLFSNLHGDQLTELPSQLMKQLQQLGLLP
jgi:hypothetical protein